MRFKRKNIFLTCGTQNLGNTQELAGMVKSILGGARHHLGS